MRKMLIILISIVITALNISSYGDLSVSELQEAKMMASSQQKEITLEKSINWGFGITFFKLIHFAELMFISEIGRKKFMS